MFDEDVEEETTVKPQDVLARLHAILEDGLASQDDIEQGIAAAVEIARYTAKEVAVNEKRLKARRGKPVAMPSDEEAFTNQCGNTAKEIEILLENTNLKITHHQLNKQGYALNHHLMTIEWQDKRWIVDPTAKQFNTYLKPEQQTPEIQEMLEKGFMDTDRPEMNEAFHQFYSAVDKRASFSRNMNELLAATQQKSPDLQDIADEFVFYPQKLRRGMLQTV